MTVALKSAPSPQRKPSRPVRLPSTESKVIRLDQVRRQRIGQRVNPFPVTPPAASVETAVNVVQALPKGQPQPLWLQSLSVVQRLSSIATTLLIGSTLAVYGLTVYGESNWTKEYPKLEQLRRQEHQLRAAQEALKNNIAIDANKTTTGLVVPQPGDMIYIEPAPPRPEKSPAPIPTVKLDSNANYVGEKPLGY